MQEYKEKQYTNLVEVSNVLRETLLRAKQLTNKFLEINQRDCDSGVLSEEDIVIRDNYVIIVEQMKEQFGKQLKLLSSCVSMII